MAVTCSSFKRGRLAAHSGTHRRSSCHIPCLSKKRKGLNASWLSLICLLTDATVWKDGRLLLWLSEMRVIYCLFILNCPVQDWLTSMWLAGFSTGVYPEWWQERDIESCLSTISVMPVNEGVNGERELWISWCYFFFLLSQVCVCVFVCMRESVSEGGFGNSCSVQ